MARPDREQRQCAHHSQETGHVVGQPGYEQHHAAIAMEEGGEREGRRVADGEPATNQDPGQE